MSFFKFAFEYKKIKLNICSLNKFKNSVYF